MKPLIASIALIGTSLTFLGCQSLSSQPSNKITVPVHAVTQQGIGQNIGTITFSDSKEGLVIQTKLSQLPAGPHGFHIHENPSCAVDLKDGLPVAALKAGGHFDPQKTGLHGHPTGQGHLGDLPLLTVAANQTANEKLLAPRLSIAQIKNRAVMIHAGGDNYSDTPEALGGGGARIACGVIQ